MLTIQNAPDLIQAVQGYASKYQIEVEDFLIEAVEKLLAEKTIEPNATLVQMMGSLEYTTGPLDIDETRDYLRGLKAR